MRTNPCVDFLRPEWAIGLSEGKPVVGAMLATKDGRRIGNGFITEVKEEPGIGTVHTVLTDAGNVVKCCLGEVEEYFWPTVFVADIKEMKKSIQSVYEFDDLDRALLPKVQKAIIDYEMEEIHPKDTLDDDDIVEALRLLLWIADETRP